MHNSIALRKIVRSDLKNEMGGNMMLAMFYGLEMAKMMDWSVEHRWWHLRQTQSMISGGQSVMVLAENEEGMPLGVLVYTQIKNRNIRRIEVLTVPKPFRGNGIAKALLNKSKTNKELHTFATPNSVSWYEGQGLRVVRKCDDGSVEMTTAKCDPKYTYDLRVPVPTEFDREFIEEMKQLEASFPISEK